MISILALAVAGVVYISIRLYHDQKKEMLYRFSWQPLYQAQQGAAAINAFLHDLADHLGTPYLENLKTQLLNENKTEISEDLENLFLTLYPRHIHSMGLLDFKGKIVLRFPKEDRLDAQEHIPEEDINRAVSSGNITVTRLFPLPDGEQAFALVVPLNLKAGHLDSLIAVVSKDTIKDLVNQWLKLDPQSLVWLVDSDGNIILHQNQEYEGENVFAGSFISRLEYGRDLRPIFKAQSRGEVGFGHYLKEGVYHIVAYAPVSNSLVNWSLGVNVPFSEMALMVKRYYHFTLIVVISFTLLAALLSFFVTDINQKRIIAEEENRLHKEKWKLEEDRRESEDRYFALYNGANDAILVLDTSDITIIEANPKSRGIIGIDPETLKGKNFLHLFPPERQEEITVGLDLLKTQGISRFRTLPLIERGRKIRQVDINCSLTRYGRGEAYICIVRDITERKELEDKIQQMDKLALFAELSAGFVHEMRNPLTGIKANAQLLERITRNDQKGSTLVKDLLKATDRLTEVVNGVSDFAKPREPSYISLGINEVVESSLKLVQAPLIKQKVELRSELENNLPLLYIDPLQIQQVFVNILTNSLQAMPRGGVLCVSSYVYPKVTAEERDLVIVRISDTGEGIEPQNLNNIFHPSFTTKHDGTGLGLAISKKILERHNSSIRISSEPTKGTTVELAFPVVFPNETKAASQH